MTDLYLSFAESPLVWFAIGFAVLVVVLQTTPRSSDEAKPVQPGAWLRRNYWAVMVLGGLGLGCFALVFYLVEVGLTVNDLVNRLRTLAQDRNAEPDDIRNVAQSVALLLAALAAAATLIFQLVRVWTTERATTATEEGLITDRINKAVEGLGAQKVVNRLGRSVRYTKDGVNYAYFEWMDDLQPRPDHDMKPNGEPWLTNDPFTNVG